MRFKVYIKVVTAILTVLTLIGSSHTAYAATPKNQGLYISPVRDYVSIAAGTQQTKNLTVANYTGDTMTIGFSVKTFDVSDLTYAYQFTDTQDNWIRISELSVTLIPNQTKQIPYTVQVPADGKPGGHYYTLFATGTTRSPGKTTDNPERLQAAAPLYITVEGALTRTSALSGSSISHVSIQNTIPFQLEVSNTGNVHYFMYINAELKGPLVGNHPTSETHLLLPGSVRRFDSSIRSPILPGLYTATYGYSTEYQPAITRVSRVFYIPPWSGAVLIILIFLLSFVIRRQFVKHRQAKEKPAAGADQPPPITD